MSSNSSATDVTVKSLAISDLRTAAALAFALSLVAGCGPSHDYELSPVRGVVNVDGKPLTGGRLMFAPVAGGASIKAGKPGFADVQADGSYVVSTYGTNDGAVVADHWITVLSGDSEEAQQQLLGATRVKVPRRVTIVGGEENVVPIELTPEEIRRFGEGAD